MKIAIGAESRFDCIDLFQIAILGALTYLKILVTNFCKEFRRILSRIIDLSEDLGDKFCKEFHRILSRIILSSDLQTLGLYYLVIYRHYYYFLKTLIIPLSKLSYLVIYRHYFILKLVINLSSDLILSSDI